MKIWKLILGLFGLVGGLFAVQASNPDGAYGDLTSTGNQATSAATTLQLAVGGKTGFSNVSSRFSAIGQHGLCQFVGSKHRSRCHPSTNVDDPTWCRRNLIA